MLQWFLETVGFSRRRPLHMAFDSNENFFWTEVSYTTRRYPSKGKPLLALVLNDLTDAVPLSGLDPVALATRHFDVRLAIDGGNYTTTAWTVRAFPPLAAGDLAIFLPLQKPRSLPNWIGPLIGEAAPVYENRGINVVRTFI